MAWVDIFDGEDGLSVRNKLNNMAKSVAPIVGTDAVLYMLEGVDLNSIADQKLDKLYDFGDYVPIRIMIMNSSGAIGSSTVGGLYTEAGKAGVQIVGASQNWGGLVNSQRMVSLPVGATVGPQNGDVYVSLTTPMGSPGTCNIYVIGFIKP